MAAIFARVPIGFHPAAPTRHTKITVGGAAIHVTVEGPVSVDSELIRTVGDNLPAFGGAPGSNGLSEIEAVIEQRDPAATRETSSHGNPSTRPACCSSRRRPRRANGRAT